MPKPWQVITADCLYQENVAKITCLQSVFANIITVVASLAAITLFIMLIVGGLRYLFSGGNPKATEAAKGTLTTAVLGLVLIVSAFVIMKLLSSFTGIDLTKFVVETEP